MSEPRAWEVHLPDHDASLVTEGRGVVEAAKAYEWPITPLVAAPPEGAPTWQELAAFIRFRCRHLGCCGGQSPDGTTCGCGLTNLLSRLPKEG
jgi:hypothetical protein